MSKLLDFQRMGSDVERHVEATTLWAAKSNVRAQERLLEMIACVQEDQEFSDQKVADRLGIDLAYLREALLHPADLTLAELRLLATACEAVIEYNVTSAREHRRALEYARVARSLSAEWRESAPQRDFGIVTGLK